MKAIRFSQHHVLMLITLVYLFSNQVQAMPTTEPISPVLQALAPSIDDHSVVLVWHAPEDTSAIADYQILQNGRPIGLASQNNDQHSPAKPYISAFYKNDASNFHHRVVMQSSKIDGLQASTSYQFTVRAIYADGGVSSASNSVTITTTAIPQVIDITHYGAKGDGTTLNTSAIQRAIDACPPGCWVNVPAGVYKTGALWMKSDMTLNLSKGATLFGSDNAADYPDSYTISNNPTKMLPASLLNVINKADYKAGVQYTRLVGPGTIDGNGWKHGIYSRDELGNSLPQYVKSNNNNVSQDGILAKNQVNAALAKGIALKTAYSQYRSNLITLHGIQNAYIAGITIRNPSNHGIVFIGGRNVIENGVIHQTFNANNGDGVEFTNNQDIIVLNSLFDTGDDCINFSAGLGQEAQKQTPTQNAWLFNNYFRHGHGAVVMGSHTGAGISNVLAENNVMNQTDMGLRAKSSPNIGGGAHDITFRNNAMANLATQAVLVTLNYVDANGTNVYTPASVPASFHNFTVKNITVQNIIGTSPSIQIEGNSNKEVWNSQLNFFNMKLTNIMPTSISNLADSQFNNVTFSNLRAGSSPWKFGKVRNVMVNGQAVPPAL
ncbi:glycoside hydrolase family 28 protein [Dickeya dianthicola]|uniref:Glycoside hydrolase family 28 protein n=1 Tax=Dickeya dianthicola TaxID=204039 RepID=A0AAP6VF47_9GAMM|nr:glycoside hydrolase family 28 protein [Dickeya dianthicola]ATO35180.1 Exo-poly-alpha-D-galacturonosidase precursor [Dickeya dianthicola RNS04.9]MBT1429929.1 glycoside hydrolase family 28 protein [Dickeya dianthicola]MBT1433957.1 glycoside hydrolase family 28 protein [Dickeya dianthicola]MBT1461446.1 glycoside hydrolase family 28 protein [Dickeya dianthicola]MBT1490640.1 glycoside hydrolase family 28 protein [Dickeya dianthicola]